MQRIARRQHFRNAPTRRIGLCLLGLIAGCNAGPQRAVRSIQATLDRQVAAWNHGDIDGFMEGYWRSPDLTFSAGGRTTRGWAATRERYKAKYDTPAKMGKLDFSGLEIRPLSNEGAFVLGRWRLQHERSNVAGNFSLVMTRQGGRALLMPTDRWVVVHDHTSLDEPAASRPSTQPR